MHVAAQLAVHRPGRDVHIRDAPHSGQDDAEGARDRRLGRAVARVSAGLEARYMRAGDSVQVVGKAIRMRAVSTGWPFRALVRRRWLQCYSMRVLWSWARPCSGHGCLGSRGHRTHRSDAVAR